MFGFDVGDSFADTAAEGVVLVVGFKAVFFDTSELIPAVVLVVSL